MRLLLTADRHQEALVTRWQEATFDYFRQLEREQRALAADASSAATRDIHLEFADRYRQQAEKLEREDRSRAVNGSGAGQD